MTAVTPRSPVASPPASGGLLESWLDGWAAAAEGVTDCLAAGWRATPGPLDVGRWLTVAGSRRRPGWASPHEIVYESPLARLRDFSSGSARGVVPTLVLPPQAGHDSCIVDYSRDQSQMRTIVAAGLRRAYTLDWVPATAQTARVVDRGLHRRCRPRRRALWRPRQPDR